MLANSKLRVTLVTTHVALKDVSKNLSSKLIVHTIHQTYLALKDYYGILHPKIAVLSLNPHSGENGLFGTEEKEIISPAIKRIKKLVKCTLSGPHPADTLFVKYADYDAIVCMYHDQGLIPVKLIDFHNTVNISLGLSIIRTSVDHGVGFDIANKGMADPASMIAAIRSSIEFSRRST
jgi:4-hydroxythreonine-4-phosphate dehydrogenase